MDQTSKEELFRSVPVPRALATMAIPTIISQLINLIYNVVDTFFIGRTGNSYMVASVTVAFSVFMMTIAMGNLFGIGGGSLLARLMGQGRTEDARRVCAFSFYGAIAISLVSFTRFPRVGANFAATKIPPGYRAAYAKKCKKTF